MPLVKKENIITVMYLIVHAKYVTIRKRVMKQTQFTALPLPECTCNSSSLLEMKFHSTSCMKRVIYERNCRVTHNYYQAGYETGYNDGIKDTSKPKEKGII